MFSLKVVKLDGSKLDLTTVIMREFVGRFIHTYMGDGNPLPSFEGEPKLVKIEGTIDSFAENIWKALNAENKVSLFVRFIDIESGKYTTKIFNKNV